MIDSESVLGLEYSICKMFHISKVELKSNLLSWLTSCSQDGISWNINSFNRKTKKLIKEKEYVFDGKVCFYHLARSLEPKPKQLKNLRSLTTTENSFSKFLKSHEIVIKWVEKRGEIYYKNLRIDPTKYSKNNLDVRLGYGSYEDTCINGFLFNLNIENKWNHYYDVLMQRPELLWALDDLLGTQLANDYKIQSQYYSVKIETTLDKLIFDGLVFRKKETKEIYYLQCCLELLAWCYYRKDPKDVSFLPIVRLYDNVNIKIREYLKQ